MNFFGRGTGINDYTGNETLRATTYSARPWISKIATRPSTPKANATPATALASLAPSFEPRKSSLPKFQPSTRRHASTSSVTSLESSRPHSPSPASFSRPRPDSFQQQRSRIPSSNTKRTLDASPSSTTSIGSPRTASRLPIPGNNRATVVTVRARNSVDGLDLRTYGKSNKDEVSFTRRGSNSAKLLIN